MARDVPLTPEQLERGRDLVLQAGKVGLKHLLGALVTHGPGPPF